MSFLARSLHTEWSAFPKVTLDTSVWSDLQRSRKDNLPKIIHKEIDRASRADDIGDSIPTIIGKLLEHLQAQLSSMLESKLTDTWEGFKNVNQPDLLVNISGCIIRDLFRLNIFFNKVHTKIFLPRKEWEQVCGDERINDQAQRNFINGQ
ncbi:hypothetical protein Patl1_18539 [Pistacia atlantica]|uniref:Uncharacterized protein n=1 Tax=Pistacia atlantica TaxID=434234 RepID=A0ACC1C182_9ROSI|nr:hypothetical protein Patl1_18539 [Pistacia atlantica]